MPEPLTMSPITSSLAALVATQRFSSADGERRWQEEANCLGVDPDLFFPERGASTREAKAVCRSCEVRVDCLEYALAHGEKFGIWGGLSERERRRVRRQRALERRTALGRLARASPRLVATRTSIVWSGPRPDHTRKSSSQRASSAAGSSPPARRGPRRRPGIAGERVARRAHASCSPVRSSSTRFIDTCARPTESRCRPERAHAGESAVALAHLRRRSPRASATSSRSSSQLTATSGSRAPTATAPSVGCGSRRTEVGSARR